MRKKSKNLLVLIILLAIIGIAVGYAALSQKLTLNGTVKSKTTSDWNVHFVKDSEQITTVGDIDSTEASFKLLDDETTGTFTATLIPNSSVEYKVTVVNDGTIDAALESVNIFGMEELPDYITCDVTPTLDDNITLNDGDTQEFNIVLSADDADELPTDEISATVTVDFNFIQTSTANN